MNKEKFIQKLEKATGLDHSKCIIINEVLENHFIIGKKNKEKIVLVLIDRLTISKEEAEKIYEKAMIILASGIKNKLVQPFKPQE